MNRRAGLFAWALAACLCAREVAATPNASGVAAAARALDAGDLAAAHEALEDLPSDQPAAQFQRAMLAFHQGDYGPAAAKLNALQQAGSLGGRRDQRAALMSWVTAARDITAGFKTATAGGGRYVVRYEEGPDAVLVPYALDTLARTDAALTRHFGRQVPGPIRLEIYPTPRALAAVSSLTVEHIETSGTVALCKWNRLMVTSPRALLHGYPWLDTVGHELVHLALNYVSAGRAPVWLHEGTAKLLERTWREEPTAAHLAPASRAALIRAARDGALLPFEKLHPSIAMLSSQEEAALAFAQVATFMERLYAGHGDAGLQQLVQAVAAGKDARAAVAQVWKQPFAQVERAWREAWRGRPSEEGKAPRVITRRFRKGESDPDDALDVEEERARRHLRLGDLLWSRQRHLAASREYERAYGFAPGDPIVASRWARSVLQQGQGAQAVAPLRAALERYPGHAPLHALLGRALTTAGEDASARDALREAVRHNPFDPAPHCGLAGIAEDTAERGREREACRRLGGQPIVSSGDTRG